MSDDEFDFLPLRAFENAPTANEGTTLTGMFRLDPDLRAGINSLTALVEQSMRLDPFARAVFAFHDRKRDRVKLLLRGGPVRSDSFFDF